SSAKRPHRPSSSFHVRTPPGQTTDARDKELPVPRSCGCYVVELYTETRTHLIAAQGRADPACRSDCRLHAGDASAGRTAPPIFHSVSFRQGQGDQVAT